MMTRRSNVCAYAMAYFQVVELKKKRGSNQNTRKSRNLSKPRVQIFSNFPFLYFSSFNRILCAMAQQLLFKFSL